MTRPKTISEVIELALQKQGVTSGRHLAARAEQLGQKLTHSTINKLRHGRYAHDLTEPSIKALATLSGLTPTAVRKAAGIREPIGPPFAEELPADADLLDARQRLAVVELIRIMVDSQKRLGAPRDLLGDPADWQLDMDPGGAARSGAVAAEGPAPAGEDRPDVV